MLFAKVRLLAAAELLASVHSGIGWGLVGAPKFVCDAYDAVDRLVSWGQTLVEAIEVVEAAKRAERMEDELTAALIVAAAERGVRS